MSPLLGPAYSLGTQIPQIEMGWQGIAEDYQPKQLLLDAAQNLGIVKKQLRPEADQELAIKSTSVATPGDESKDPTGSEAPPVPSNNGRRRVQGKLNTAKKTSLSKWLAAPRHSFRTKFLKSLQKGSSSSSA